VSLDPTKKKEKNPAETLAQYLKAYSEPIGGNPDMVYLVTADAIKKLFSDHWDKVSVLAHQVHEEIEAEDVVRKAALAVGGMTGHDLLALLGMNSGTPMPYNKGQSEALRLVAKKFLEREDG